jgi:hypothetical protein
LILRVVPGAAHGDHLAASHVRAALRRRDIRFASANQDFNLIVREHRDPVAAIATARMDRKIRSVDLDVRFAVLQNRVVGQAAGQLNLDLLGVQARNVGLGAFVNSQNIGIVKLKFGARIVARGNAIAGDDGCVQHS